MPKVTAAHRAARRRQILDAAYTCFARKGFHETSMRDIYAEARLSPGAVYHYFRSKDEIVEAIITPDYQRNMALLEAVTQHADPLAALDGLTTFFFQVLDDGARHGAPRVNVEGWAEMLRNPRIMAFLQPSFARYAALLAQICAQAQERGEIDSALDPLAVAQVYLSFYFGLELQKAWDPQVDVWTYVTVIKALLNGSFRQGDGSDGNQPRNPS